MTSPPSRCPTCDRPAATDEDLRDIGNGRESESVCFAPGSPDCLSHAVDWRKRAIEAEAQRDAVIATVESKTAVTFAEYSAWLDAKLASAHSREVEAAAERIARLSQLCGALEKIAEAAHRVALRQPAVLAKTSGESDLWASFYDAINFARAALAAEKGKG